MIRGYFGRITTMATTLPWASSAWACPLCESETGERVRAGIFDADFGYNLAATLLPFPVLLGVAALIRFGPRPPSCRAPLNPEADLADTPTPPDDEDRP